MYIKCVSYIILVYIAGLPVYYGPCHFYHSSLQTRTNAVYKCIINVHHKSYILLLINKKINHVDIAGLPVYYGQFLAIFIACHPEQDERKYILDALRIDLSLVIDQQRECTPRKEKFCNRNSTRLCESLGS